MAKKRMNRSIREDLKVLARNLVTCPDEGKAEDAAYKKAVRGIRPAVEKRWPAKEMAILKKHECGREYAHVPIASADGGISEFIFKPDEEIYRPGGYSRKMLPVTNAVYEAVEDWRKAVSAHEKALTKKLDDYTALIFSVKYFEDIVEIWPEAMRCSPSAIQLPVVSDDVVNRVKADVALRSKGS